ncbi:hypothetical protein FJ444_08015 [Aestuariibacter sp. GS-14]|uniref:hypothetical protein n=1 Tax=Aestuariibacter sp. GS-14 TaxID=2590670 RepID=UPI00112B8D40|nr:hypothetical protein [Aestuariibacter sp. GS-14]TPV58994.1 hypothetical protein FJ444_08015 [Aestuariibacter sp. GS-14]
MTTQHVEMTDKQIIKGLAIASVIAVVLSVTVILPAEYNKDPSGVGAILGLTGMSNNVQFEEMTLEPQNDFTFAQGEGEWQTHTLTLEIPDYEGVEVKALTEEGNGFSFTWETDGGELYMDMHGEVVGDTDEFTSYKKSNAISSDKGIFKAPFHGTHGWYWQNNTDSPITVTITVAGFYQSVKTLK